MTGSGAGFRQAGINHVDLGADQVHLADGTHLIDQVTGIITVGEFYACAAGARSSSPERAVTAGGLLS